MPDVTRGALLREALDALAAAGVEDARRNAEWLLEDALGVGRAGLYGYPEAAVPPEAAARVRAGVARRAAGEPVQYVLGHADFYGLRLAVGPGVLIPRPETEEVVEAALARVAGVAAPRVLDVGTGSGCIALAVADARPDARVAACDVSPRALAVARGNAERLGLAVRFVEADVLGAAFAGAVPDALHLLVSNPPYIPDAEREALAVEVRDHEPALALFAGDDPLRFYRALARHAPRLVRPGGHVVLEAHPDHAAAAAALLADAGFRDVHVAADLAGRPRIVCGVRADDSPALREPPRPSP